ncbi:hypothetical protein BN1708_019342, partial [Verticillium longisporum]
PAGFPRQPDGDVRAARVQRGGRQERLQDLQRRARRARERRRAARGDPSRHPHEPRHWLEERLRRRPPRAEDQRTLGRGVEALPRMVRAAHCREPRPAGAVQVEGRQRRGHLGQPVGVPRRHAGLPV